MPLSAEAVQEQGRKYVQYVNEFFTNIARFGESLPIWSPAGNAYTNPRMVKIPIKDGEDINFDLCYTLLEKEIGKPIIQLYVEAKGSYDISYVEKEFRAFMRKIFILKDKLLNADWEQTHFIFIAPVNPTSCANPKQLTDFNQLKSLYQEIYKGKIDSDNDKFIHEISKRIHIVQLPYENEIIFKGGA